MPRTRLAPKQSQFPSYSGVPRIASAGQRRRRSSTRKGSAAVLGVVLLAVLAGALAYGIDVGFAKSARAEIQRTSDAAALAACWKLFEEKRDETVEEVMLSNVATEAQTYANYNLILGESASLSIDGVPTYEIGHYNWATRTFSKGSSPTNDYNAVRVVVHRSAEVNGTIPMFFSSLFGVDSVEMQSGAIAAMGYQINGFSLPPGSSETLPVMPFALDLETWDGMLGGEGNDDWGYDPDFGVTAGGDGIREMNLYPQETGSPGNRGTVDIGPANNSTADLARQITDGVSANDLEQMNQELKIPSAVEPLLLEGDPGISAGLKDELASVIGETRVIPIFSSLSGNGNNAVYNIVKFVGVRVLEVKLTGSNSGKRVMVQPANIMVRGAIVDTSGNSEVSSGIYTPVTLVQ